MEHFSRHASIVFAIVAVLVLPLLFASSAMHRISDLAVREYGNDFLDEAGVTGTVTDGMYDDLAAFAAMGKKSISLELRRYIYEPVYEDSHFTGDVVMCEEMISDGEIRELLFEGPGSLMLEQDDRLLLRITGGRQEILLMGEVREKGRLGK